MDDTLTYGQICRVIKDVNSEIRQDRKESVGRGPSAGQVGTACNYAHGASCSVDEPHGGNYAHAQLTFLKEDTLKLPCKGELPCQTCRK